MTMTYNQLPLRIRQHFSPRANRTQLRCDECGQRYPISFVGLNGEALEVERHIASHQAPVSLYSVIKGETYMAEKESKPLPPHISVGQVYQFMSTYIVVVEAANPKHAQVKGQHLIEKVLRPVKGGY